MAEELVMPRLSDTMERGTVARWLKAVGDEVHAGDVVAEIETDKATMEYQSDLDGVLLQILVGDGETADLGAVIALVGEPGEEVAGNGAASGGGATETAPQQEPEAAAEPAAEPSAEAADGAERQDRPQQPEQPAEPAQPAAAAAEESRPASMGDGRGAAQGPLKASPIARKIADENGIDLRDLAGRGSGPDGRIVRADVERLVERQGRREELPPAPAAARAKEPVAALPPLESEVVELSRMQRIVARRMAESKATVPHFYLTAEIDMGRALELRKELNRALEAEGVKVSVNDLIVRACGLALRDNRQFHRSFDGEHMVYHGHADVGIAVALDDGLIVPVVRAVESKTLRQVAVEARELAERARAGSLKQPEIEGATFTVSNLGMFGITQFGAIINPPEPGILAVGATVERAVPRDGEVTVRPIMNVTLSVDHRAASGADGARFLQTLQRYLEEPLLLVVG
jgi:pyruvate dehydrogenase E2 component (dihydrolipoamide acetyltransferase)